MRGTILIVILLCAVQALVFGAAGPARAQDQAAPAAQPAPAPQGPSAASVPQPSPATEIPQAAPAAAVAPAAQPAAEVALAPTDPVVASIRAKLAEESIRKDANAADIAALEAFYAERAAPLWVTEMGFSAKAQAALFEIEMDRIFARMWLAAGRAAGLDHAGAFIRRDVAGASVLIVRTADGSIRAHHNVCRHRGTRLCTDPGGTFQGSIQCPYHAWTYGLDGRLRAAPLMDEVDGFDRAEFPLRSVACEVWDGHIFINLADVPEPLAGQLGDLPQRFAPYAMQDLRLAHRIDYDLAANWKLVVQN